MSRRSEQTCFQRRYTEDQQSPEKMHKISNHQRSTIQNHNEILSHNCQIGYYWNVYK